MLEKFLVCEREFFGNNVKLEFLQIDCSIAETNAICETLNGVLREVYMRTLEHRARVECMTAIAVAKSEGWTLVAWCLFHMRRAWNAWCSAAATFTPPVALTRDVAKTIVIFFLDDIRRAETHERQDASIKNAVRLLSAPRLADISGLSCVTIGHSTAGDALVQLRGFGVDLDINAGPYDEKAANPLMMSGAVRYIERWVSLKVFWTDLYIGERTRRCNTTSEVSNNQMKHFEYENLPMRLDRFIVHDEKIVSGVAARFFDELTKNTAGGGRSLSQTARERASATATTGESEQSCANGAAAATSVGADDAARALEAPADTWSRGGISHVARAAVVELTAAMAKAPKISQLEVAKQLLEFAFGGQNPRLHKDERSSFPGSQTAISALLRNQRNASAAACRVIGEWSRQRGNGNGTGTS